LLRTILFLFDGNLNLERETIPSLSRTSSLLGSLKLYKVWKGRELAYISVANLIAVIHQNFCDPLFFPPVHFVLDIVSHRKDGARRTQKVIHSIPQILKILTASFSRNNKIAHDPNNTKWTGDTSSFGHKLMASQGWKPGDYLGAKDANHAEHYTAANASHIRVMVKDDNLGLGAKIGSGVGHGECTGLDAFKNLLGRLNGQDEVELEKERKSRDDLRRAIYMEDRWGSVRFVQGGFLIGDKIQDLIDGEAERIRKLGTSPSVSDSSSSDSEESAPVEKPKKSKKRKLEVEEDIPEVVAVKFKKSKKRKVHPGSEEETKSKVEDSAAALEKKRRKEEKRAKRERKEQRRALKAVSEEESEKQQKKKAKKEKRKKNLEYISEPTSQITTKENTPSISSAPLVDSGRSTPMMQGRHAIRSRNIAQKRLASMDVASLNQVSWFSESSICSTLNNLSQIFMIKAPS